MILSGSIKKRRSAFTLVELLVVMAIIAILVSIFLPAIGNAQRRALGAVCRSNLRQIGTAMVAYAGDQRGLLPFWGEPEDFGWPAGSAAGTARASGGAQWPVQIAPYLGIDWEWGSVSPPAELGRRPTLFYCPGGLPFHINPEYDLNFVMSVSYNYNQRIGQIQGAARSLMGLTSPQDTLLVVDAHRQDEWTGYQCRAPSWICDQHQGIIRVTESTPQRFCYDRHGELTHVLLATLNVEARPRSSHLQGGVAGLPAGIRFSNGAMVYPWP